MVNPAYAVPAPQNPNKNISKAAFTRNVLALLLINLVARTFMLGDFEYDLG